MSTTDISTTTNVAVVDVKPAMASKINWTQFVGGASMLITFGTGGKFGITPDQQVAIVTVIGVAQAALTFVLKTWFTTSVTPSAAGK